MVAGFGLAYYALMEFAFCRVDAWRTGPHRPSPDVAAFGRWNITWRFCFVCLLVCWLPYFIVFFPGESLPIPAGKWLSSSERAGCPRQSFSYLTTLFYGACYAAGNALGGSIVAGTAFAVAAQACICAAAFSTIVSGMRSCNAYRLSRWALYFFAFFPWCRPTWLRHRRIRCTLLWRPSSSCRCCWWPFKTRRRTARACHLAARAGARRRAGVPHPQQRCVPRAAGLDGNRLYRTQPHRRACLGSTILCVLLWQCAVLPAANVSAGEPGEALSIPAQITGNYLSVYADELTDADAAVLARSFACSPADLASAYDPRLSDNVKSEFSFADSTALRDYLGLSAQMVARHPVSSVGAALIPRSDTGIRSDS